MSPREPQVLLAASWDIFLALVGAVAALLALSGAHDRALANLPRGAAR